MPSDTKDEVFESRSLSVFLGGFGSGGRFAKISGLCLFDSLASNSAKAFKLADTWSMHIVLRFLRHDFLKVH